MTPATQTAPVPCGRRRSQQPQGPMDVSTASTHLDVVVEAQDLVSVPLKNRDSVLVVEVLELQQDMGPSVLESLNAFVPEGTLLTPGTLLHRVTPVYRTAKYSSPRRRFCLIPRYPARVRSSLLSVPTSRNTGNVREGWIPAMAQYSDTAGGIVRGDIRERGHRAGLHLPIGIAIPLTPRSPRPEAETLLPDLDGKTSTTRTEDAASVCNDGDLDVLAGPVVRHGDHCASVVRTEEEPSRPPKQFPVILSRRRVSVTCTPIKQKGAIVSYKGSEADGRRVCRQNQPRTDAPERGIVHPQITGASSFRLSPEENSQPCLRIAPQRRRTEDAVEQDLVTILQAVQRGKPEQIVRQRPDALHQAVLLFLTHQSVRRGPGSAYRRSRRPQTSRFSSTVGGSSPRIPNRSRSCMGNASPLFNSGSFRTAIPVFAVLFSTPGRECPRVVYVAQSDHDTPRNQIPAAPRPSRPSCSCSATGRRLARARAPSGRRDASLPSPTLVTGAPRPPSR